MIRYKVRKGLESPLKIWGMKKEYFYLFSVVTAILIIIVIFKMVNTFQNVSLKAFGSFLIFIIIAFFIITALKFILSYLSDRNPMKFGNSRILISNKDFLKTLKK